MKITEIKDFDAPELDVFAKETESQLLHKFEPHGAGVFIAESPYVIGLALDAGYIPISALVQKSLIDSEIVKRLKDIPIYTAENEILTKITGFNLTFGIVCQMQRKETETVESICNKSSRIAILEHVMNPTNIGAIMRSAAALGIDGILLSADCSDPLYRRAARVSMGTVFKMPYAYFQKGAPHKNIGLVKSLGFKTFAMALSENSVPIGSLENNKYEKLAIVLGSEGEGLTKESIAACDFTVKIPMKNGVDSLNVAAASAIAFWEMTT